MTMNDLSLSLSLLKIRFLSFVVDFQRYLFVCIPVGILFFLCMLCNVIEVITIVNERIALFRLCYPLICFLFLTSIRLLCLLTTNTCTFTVCAKPRHTVVLCITNNFYCCRLKEEEQTNQKLHSFSYLLKLNVNKKIETPLKQRKSNRKKVVSNKQNKKISPLSKQIRRKSG